MNSSPSQSEIFNEGAKMAEDLMKQRILDAISQFQEETKLRVANIGYSVTYTSIKGQSEPEQVSAEINPTYIIKK